ncbi:hypothetical protein KIPB_009093 [Kipferlia bialata]|uniref:Uncharacterized protein n=1 Tax=Kipferlia bialata TaxID=797122 RepID=A0A9K3GKD3_9EUKA|nr:hypothetical protein KIPB_009093 [Kipferlia bialata]|eukprot:g9093.t1
MTGPKRDSEATSQDTLRYEGIRRPLQPRQYCGTLALLWCLYKGTPQLVQLDYNFECWGELVGLREQSRCPWIYRIGEDEAIELTEAVRKMFSDLTGHLGVECETVVNLSEMCIDDNTPIPIGTVQEQTHFLDWMKEHRSLLGDVEPDYRDTCLRLLDEMLDLVDVNSDTSDVKLAPITWETLLDLTHLHLEPYDIDP